MYDLLRHNLEQTRAPLDVIMVGLGFMGFGFLSNSKQLPGIRVPLVITRDVERSRNFLQNKGYDVRISDHPDRIMALANRGGITVSDNLELLKTFPNQLVFEVTGTIAYGTEVALRTIEAGKHLVTMNPELQVTVGSELKKLADAKGVVISDVLGDQPGNLANLIHQAALQGFKIRLAGNMKRFLDIRATQAKMKPWADDKGLSVRQTTSFTDGTKQSIEMELVGNHFGYGLMRPGMFGPEVDTVEQMLDKFDWAGVPASGVVDYAIGKTLFPGVFVIAEHTDPEQTNYLRYLKLGDGPRYVLFDPYHLTHLEVIETIAKVALFRMPTIDNSTRPVLRTFTAAKFDLKAGTVLDGIGGDCTYGILDQLEPDDLRLPVGLGEGAVLKRDINADQSITYADVSLPDHAATRLLGLTGNTSDATARRKAG